MRSGLRLRFNPPQCYMQTPHTHTQAGQMIRLPSWPSLATTLTQEVGLLATRPIELPYLAGPVWQPKSPLHC